MDTTEERGIAGEDFRHDLLEVRRRAEVATEYFKEAAGAVVERGLAALAVVEAAEAYRGDVIRGEDHGWDLQTHDTYDALCAALDAWRAQ